MSTSRCLVPASECCGGCDHSTPEEAWYAEALAADTRDMDRIARRDRPRLRYRVSLMPTAYWSRSVRDGLPF